MIKVSFPSHYYQILGDGIVCRSGERKPCQKESDDSDTEGNIIFPEIWNIINKYIKIKK